ncbi:ribbon-helix-helix domain-containing protein [Futiania mangrovi]|uniref:Ribbon-helix-helix domain-containing protein n=1 Tax=Futiania mangrovi TaxID=2959716 RepID=A0A9J6PHW1_9PROT|nr:ribbon-helix-helix domain-containing protein [Futiania mangrovii]MCP1336159.1 ribbon-helix-helix domain-containing protein [Futiania mangrovii]
MFTSLISRNVRIGEHRTSVRLEPELWEALEDICMREDLSLHDVCTEVAQQDRSGGFTSALRVFVIRYFRAAAAGRDVRSPVMALRRRAA